MKYFPVIIGLLVCHIFTETLRGEEYFVSPEGQPGGTGRRESPFAHVEEALEAVKKLGHASNVGIVLEDGIYPISQTLILDATFSGAAGAPFIIRAEHARRATLTSIVPIPLQQLHAPDDKTRISLIQPSVLPHIKALSLKGTQAGNSLNKSGHGAVVISEGYLLPVACWPNRGYAHIEKILDRGAVYTSGRTLGEIPKATDAEPIGGEFSLREHHEGNWNEELAAHLNKPMVEGFFSQDWHYEKIQLARCEGEKVKLLDYTRYGVKMSEKLPRRIRFSGLLSELDEPGEWFWDRDKKTFYIWPLGGNHSIGVGTAGNLIEIFAASHVQIEGLVFEGAQCGVSVHNGQNVIVAKCEARSLINGFHFDGGKSHKILSCDIHDMDSAISMSGTILGDAKRQKADPAHLLDSDEFEIDNNHIWNIHNKSCCRIMGVGWKFTHNLVHNLAGSALSWSGNDVLVAFNEFYEVASEVGDDGVTHCGGAWWAHGDLFKNNFIHDIYNLPQAHGIVGFYYDDLQQGDTTFGNVFYKVANRAVFIHGGAAQTVANNLFINCYNNIMVGADAIQENKEAKKKYDSGQLKRGDKQDYWWRTEQVVGPEGWKKEPWTKYPQFAQAMEKDPYSPVLTDFHKNYESGTIHEGILLSKVPAGMINPEPLVKIDPSVFQDPEVENFAFKSDFHPMPGFTPIPFDQIGLVKNTWRSNPPDKNTYRREVNRRNAGRKCFDPEAKYDPDLDNKRLHPTPGYLLGTRMSPIPLNEHY